MKHILPLVILLALAGCRQPGHEQRMERYFRKIRGNEAMLTAFMQAMPKGGDLHNHYSGSVYAERYVADAIEKDYWIDTLTLLVSNKAGKNEVQFSALNKLGQLAGYEERLLEKWSVKDYVPEPGDAPDAHFFNTFKYFAAEQRDVLPDGLLELKARAETENVQYLEVMLKTVPFSFAGEGDYQAPLMATGLSGGPDAVNALLEAIYTKMQANHLADAAAGFDTALDAMHSALHMDDSLFAMRYQLYAARTAPPDTFFTMLVAAFEAASRDKAGLIVGINIVAPENNEVALRDYRLHMLMFNYCHKKYPQVHYAMHAGELVPGMVKPEDLTWHINDAIHIAGAQRIGHGVDIPYEHNCTALLKEMKQNNIPVEINLSSNEFILGVKDDRHPIMLYKKAGVPIIISSDDPGVLRSSLTQQYVALAKRYPVSYGDIKKFVFNSIQYSFLDSTAKQKELAGLKQRFQLFELGIVQGMGRRM